MQDWWVIPVPIVAAGFGYWIRRIVEGRRRSEALKRKLQALALYQGMARARVSMRDLERIERDTSGV